MEHEESEIYVYKYSENEMQIARYLITLFFYLGYVLQLLTRES